MYKHDHILNKIPPSFLARETITPPHSSPYLRGGWVGLKTGKRRFYDLCSLTYELLNI
jgi:hypothetical protein